MRIRHSVNPYEELKLEGSVSEFSELRSAILGFCETDEASIALPVKTKYEASADLSKLNRLRLCKTNNLLLISVTEGQLFISGEARLLRLFAEKLPCEADQNSNELFKRIAQTERISEASLEIVLNPNDGFPNSLHGSSASQIPA